MDLITQAFLGAALGELMLGKRLGNRALAWGALFGVMPELDVIVYPLIDTARELAFHRGPSHSLIVMMLGSWGIGHGLEKLWVRDKISKTHAGLFVYGIWAAHVLADCFTTEGAAVFWPFPVPRVSFNHLYPTDLFVVAPLLITVVWLAFLRDAPPAKKNRSKKAVAAPVPMSKRRKLCLWGLGLSAAYVLLSVGMKYTASAGFEADLARRGTKFLRHMEAPMPYNILLWRCVVDRGDEFWVGYRTVFEFKETPVRWTVYLKGEAALEPVAGLRETKTLTRLTDGWWLARNTAKGAWLGDLRYPETRTWGSKKGMVDSRLKYSWSIYAESKGDRLRPVLLERGNFPETMRRMGARILGKRETWEANPRLAGVTGSLPEFLPVEE